MRRLSILFFALAVLPVSLGGCQLFYTTAPKESAGSFSESMEPLPAGKGATTEPGAAPENGAQADTAPETQQAETTPEAEPEAALSPEPLSPTPAPEDFVLVEAYLPEVRTDLRYATKNNFTGQIIYDFTDAYLRYGTVQKLAAAQESLTEQGYGLLIWDAFRPTAAQFKLWEVFPDPVYVANPEKGFSSHSRGNTVDVTLVTLEGEPVKMPTDFDDFSILADRDYSDIPATAVENALLLETVMQDCGFKPYSDEWWHFSDTDSYPVEKTFIPK